MSGVEVGILVRQKRIACFHTRDMPWDKDRSLVGVVAEDDRDFNKLTLLEKPVWSVLDEVPIDDWPIWI